MSRISTHRLVLAVALAALAGPARAEPPCAPDAKRFCAGNTARELLSCLQSHRPDLAPACVARVERVLVFFQDAAIACKADAYEFCPRTGPGLAMVDCLRERDGKLTPPCQQYFERLRARDASVERACKDELARSCPGVTAGRGELWMCLGLGSAEVSEACAAVL